MDILAYDVDVVNLGDNTQLKRTLLDHAGRGYFLVGTTPWQSGVALIFEHETARGSNPATPALSTESTAALIQI
jgi:hypothetical protein